MEWNEDRPQRDGEYLVTLHGRVTILPFTVVGGWNTHKFGNEYFTDSKFEDSDITAWMPMPKPAHFAPVEWGYEE